MREEEQIARSADPNDPERLLPSALRTTRHQQTLPSSLIPSPDDGARREA